MFRLQSFRLVSPASCLAPFLEGRSIAAVVTPPALEVTPPAFFPRRFMGTSPPPPYENNVFLNRNCWEKRFGPTAGFPNHNPFWAWTCVIDFGLKNIKIQRAIAAIRLGHYDVL
ncbi:hypothetical protein Salat_2898800 [Sesamum alatum]|uniref:Uncharacterized protein n=1 Tax=Sesamum alatum TaxID=300844 RepID=A0AAE2C834_9LAMI|nr:hypothetical protein Salat_2898800 [Sesamum alatum]